VIDYI
jgi:hypothetical protein